MSKTAMKLALEALERVGVMLNHGYNVLPDGEAHEDVLAAITALREALAEQPVVTQQLTTGYVCVVCKDAGEMETGIGMMACDACPPALAEQPALLVVPDAFGTREGEHPEYIQGWNDCRAEMLRGTPAQRTWAGLSDEEKQQIFEREDYQGWLDYINAIEAKLKEKNNV